jgi:hypothetical protein
MLTRSLSILSSHFLSLEILKVCFKGQLSYDQQTYAQIVLRNCMLLPHDDS